MSEPDVLFGATGGVGAIVGCELKSDEPKELFDRARGLNSVGTEAAKKLQNGRKEFISVYNILSDTNEVLALILGALKNSRMITGADIETGNGEENNTVRITSHQHNDNPHADTLPQVALSTLFTEPVAVTAFGAVDFLQGTAGTAASPVRGSLSASCQHNDKTGKLGNHFVGRNFDATARATTNWEGVPTTPAVADWDVVTKSNPVDNTDFQTTSVEGTKAMVLVNPA